MHRKKGVKEKGQSKKRKNTLQKAQNKKARKSKNAFTCPKFKLLLDFV